jgi:hypothetical protein
MAYGPKFRVEGASIDGHTYRADIEQEGYSGSVQRFTAAADGLRLSWDIQSRQDLNEPWMIGTGFIRVKEEDPSHLAEIFDGGTFEYRVRIFQDDTEYFVGFAQTDLYEDSTWQAVSDPRVKFTDGLGRLGDIAFSEAGSEEDVRQAIMRALNLLPTDVGAEINMRWMPNGISSLPIEKLYVPDEAWVEDDTDTAPNPSPKRKTGRAVLRGLLRRFGMRLMQSGGQWRMRQRLSLMDDSLEVSTYNQDGTRASSGTKSGRERDLTTLNADEESRSFQSEFGASSVKYNFKTPLRQVLPNPSFEDTLSRWNTAGDAQRVDIDTVSDLQKTSGDQKAVKMTTNDANLNIKDAIELPPDPRIAMVLGWGDVRETKVGKVKAETGSGHTLRRRTVTVDNPALAGEETTLQLVQEVGQVSGEEVTGMPIVPAGAELKLYTDDPSVSPIGNKIRLTEPLRVGEESVTGELAQKITSTDDQDLKPQLAYWQWASFSNSEETRIDNDNYFTRHSIRVFMVHPSGDPVHGPLDVSWFMKDDTSSGFYALDDVSLKFERDGELIESFSTTAVDETGDREIIEVPVGVGPTDRSESRIYTFSEDTPQGWGRDSNGSETLSGLHSTESLQMQRTSPETRRFQLRLRADDPDVLPHHIFLDGGTRYEAIGLRRDLLRGIAKVNLVEVQNDGTTGLNTTTALGSDNDDGASGSGSSVQVLDGAGGASKWGELGDKPFSTIGDGLAVTNGDLNLDAAHAAGAGLTTTSDSVMAVDVAGLAGDGLQESGGDFAVDSTVARTDRDEVFSGDLALDDGSGAGPRLRGEQERLEVRQQADATSYGDVEARDGVLHGDLTVMGDTTTTGDVFETEAETVQVSDSIANLNFGETGAGVTAARGVSGWSIDRGTVEPYAFAFHESDGLFRIGEHWLTLSHDAGTPFSLHEEVVGQSSGASGYVWADSSGTLQIKNWHGAFDAAGGETIEGQSSGATASLTGKTEHDDTQAVATREDSPIDGGVPIWSSSENRFATTDDLVYGNQNLVWQNIGQDQKGIIFRETSSGEAFSIRYDGSGTGGGNTLQIRSDAAGSLQRILTARGDQKLGLGEIKDPDRPLHVPAGANNDAARLQGHLWFSGEAPSGIPVLRTPGTGSSGLRVFDNANSQAIARFEEGGKTIMPNGGLLVGADSAPDRVLHTVGDAVRHDRTDGDVGPLLRVFNGDGTLRHEWHMLADSDGGLFFRNDDNSATVPLRITESHKVRPDGFVAKTDRWQIDHQGRADFRRVYTDELVAKSFVTDITQALAGSDYLTKSVATLAEPFTIPPQGNTATLTVNDLPGQEDARVFEAGDWVRLRVVDKSSGGLVIVDAWGTVANYSDNADGTQEWTFTREDGDTAADGKEVGEDAPALDYGQSSQGLMRRTVEGPDAPLALVQTWETDPIDSSNYTTHLAYGNLSGVSDPSSQVNPSGWGLYTENGYFRGEIAAKTGDIIDHITVGDSDGVAIGNNVTRFDGESTVLVGFYNDGNTPVVKARGSNGSNDGASFAQMVGRGGSSGNYFTIRHTGDDIVTVSGDKADFFGWEATRTRLKKSVKNNTVETGTLAAGSIQGTGFHAVHDSGREVGMMSRNSAKVGDDLVHLVAYESKGNEVLVGQDYRGILDGIGIRARSQGNDILEVDESGGIYRGDLSVQALPSAPRDDALLALFRWDHEGQNTHLNYATGNRNSPAQGSTQYGSGVSGPAWDVNNDTFFTADVGDPSTDKFTISVWVYWRGDTGDGDSNEGICRPSDTGSEIGLWVDTSNSVLWGRVDNNDFDSNNDAAKLSTNQWHHVALVADGTNGTLYLDGEQVDQVTYDGTLSSFSGLDIGTQGGEIWNGMLDEFRYYNVPLSENQLRALRLSPSGLGGTITAQNSISTPMLVAEAVTADEVASNTITADEIAADTITAGNLKAGSITAEVLDTDSVFTQNIDLKEGGAFRMGPTDTDGFWIGDFQLGGQSLDTVSHNIGEQVSGTSSGTSTSAWNVRGENQDLEGYRATVSANYSMAINPVTFGDPIQGEVSVALRVRVVDSGGSVLDSSEESIVRSNESGSWSGALTVTMMLPANAYDIELQVEASYNNTDNADCQAAIGDTTTESEDPTSDVATATDHVGTNGFVWRDSSGTVAAELNATGASGNETGVKGEMYLADTLTENSDLRNKTDVVQIGDGLDVIRELRGLRYTKNGRPQAGVGAQDLLGVFEEAVRGSEEAGYRVAHSALFAPVIEGLRTLDEKTLALDERMTDVENEIDQLQDRIDTLKAEQQHS